MNDEIRRLAEEVKKTTGMSIAEFAKSAALTSEAEKAKRMAEEIKRATGGMSIAEFAKAAATAEEERTAELIKRATGGTTLAEAVKSFEQESALEEVNRMNRAFATPQVLPVLDLPRIELPAQSMRKRLLAYINEFEQQLDEEHEIGGRLVSFGQAVRFHIENVGYYGGDMISFSGRDENGQALLLVQHYTQLSVLLIAMKKQKPDEKPRRIGFITD